MIQNLYVVRDVVSEQVPFGVLVYVNHGSAIRFFQDLVREPSGPVGQHPRDYELWYVGQMDTGTAEIEPLSKDAFVLMAKGSDYSAEPGKPEVVK